MSQSHKSRRLSRRRFGAAVVAASGATMLAQQQTPPPGGAPNPNTSVQAEQQRRNGPPPEVPPFDQPFEFKRKDVPSKVEPFPMRQVRLLPGAFQDLEQWNRGYMQRLPVDSLVYNFRENAGLPTPGKAFGGWEQRANGQRGSELRGHFTGHFLSATALLYASTGDKEAKAKGDEMVGELAKVQQKLGGGYLSAYPMELFDRLENLTKPGTTPPVRGANGPQLPWAPFYTIHKIMAGMFDMYQLTGNKQALQVLEGMSEWADNWTGSKSEEHMQRILNIEYGGIAETLYNLSAATNNDRWAKVGDRYTKKRFVNPLAMHRDELRGLHVNTHVPQVIAAARRYEISGDHRFHDVADYFFYTVSTSRSYVTGGTSNGEGWQVLPNELGKELKMNISTAECCCVYNTMKLARHLYSWTGEPGYFDYYERILLNHRLGTIQPQTGYTQYYLSLYPGAWKTFNSEDQSFWCCTGTGVEEYSKLNDSIYWRDKDGVYVNLFLPSELNWSEKGFRLKQETKYPEQQSTTLTVSVNQPTQMMIRLRIPAWLQSSPTIKVNGKAIEASAAPGSYLALSRTWKTGDKVEMALPMHLHTESMADQPQLQAYLYGPLVLAGDLGNEGLTKEMIVGPNAPRIRRPNFNGQGRGGNMQPAPEIQIPTFRASGDPASWIKPADKPLTFRTSGQTKDVSLMPLNSIFDRRYNVYWEVS